jgi:FlaA1/EpsC-like NDP-sugar epimerase
MIDNNIFKTRDLLDLLLHHKPEHFFCVSTDKAVNPVNVMGATKKLMEDLIMAYSAEMNITTARFANVAFSNGSLLDGYMQRILKKQPISCPEDVKRFFVSPQESGQPGTEW